MCYFARCFSSSDITSKKVPHADAALDDEKYRTINTAESCETQFSNYLDKAKNA